MVQAGLKAFPAARKAILEALAMEELSLQEHEQYGSMLRVLGVLDREEGRYKEALVIYNTCWPQHKEGHDCGSC